MNEQAVNVVRWVAPTATLRVSRAVYSYDVSRLQTVEDLIPLGVFVDVQISDLLYGLGLMARKSVAETELERVGKLARPLVAEPFNYLNFEFDRIMGATDRASAFAGLPIEHSTALQICTAVERKIDLPRHLRVHDRQDALKVWAKDVVVNSMTDAYWSLLDEHWPNSNVVGNRGEREDVKIAA